MARFIYKVKNSAGSTLSGIVEASNIKQAANLLHEKGFYVIKLKEQTVNLFRLDFAPSGVSFNDVVHFTRQLSTMITAGLTLVEALSVLLAQLKKKSLINLISKIEEEIKGGKTLAEILEKYPKIFSPAYVALVRAGEASGKLDVILSRLSDNLEKSRDFRNKVSSALIYPAIIVSGMVIVSVVVLTVVIPRLTSLYKEFKVDLPLPTQIFIFISSFMVNNLLLIIIILIVLVIFILYWRKTWFGKHLISALALNLPLIGPLIRESTLVEVTRTLAILVDGGVPILTALEISEKATSNILFQEAIAIAGKRVEKGFPLSDTFSEYHLFPPILGQMMAVGEQTGKLSDSMMKLSRYFETEADTAVRALTTMIEPLIMVILGIGVGFLVMAVLLPIYSLATKF